MKTVVPVRKHTGRAMRALVLACIVTALTLASVTGLHAASRSKPGDSILVQKTLTSKKYKIRLYPNANNEVLFFSASGNEGKVYQLFLFDIEGKLVKQVNIKNKQTTVLNNIEKGDYLFQVFSDDEQIENGQVIVK
jgi:hypothetical protein